MVHMPRVYTGGGARSIAQTSSGVSAKTDYHAIRGKDLEISVRQRAAESYGSEGSRFRSVHGTVLARYTGREYQPLTV